MVTDVPPASVEFIGDQDIDVLTWQRWYQLVVGFNGRHEALRNSAVRRALNVAIDRELVIGRVLQGLGRPATGPVWPKHWAYDSSIPEYAFDQGSARALLDEAGYRVRHLTDGLGVPNVRFRFTCLLPEGYSVLERIGLELQRQLYDIGVDMRFEVVKEADYRRRVATGKFDAVLVDMISGPSLGRPYLFWRSASRFQGLNVFAYENPEAERMFDSLRTAINDAAVISTTAQLQRVLLDDPPALFIAWTDRARAVRRDFRVHQEPGRDPLSTLWMWGREPAPRLASAQ